MKQGQTRGAGSAAVGGVFLDSGDFERLKESVDRTQVIGAWLATLGRQNRAIRQSVVLLSATGSNRFEPAAIWPPGAKPEKPLLSSAEAAVRSGRGILQTLSDKEGGGVAVAVPVTLGGQVCGSASLVLNPLDEAGVQLILDQLQWGSAWIETFIQRSRVSDSAELVTVVELLATSLHHQRFQEAATATATELATALGCERVAIAFRRGQRCRVRALSHSANVGKRSSLVRAIEAAMDEAVDQEATIVVPQPPDAPQRVIRRQEALQADHAMGTLCTVPLSEGRKLIGALLLERPEGVPFDRSSVRLAEHAAALLGPTLDTKRKEDRWLPAKAWDAAGNLIRAIFGPRHAALKLGVLLLAAFVAFCWYATGTYRVTADAVLEGTVQRAVTVPVAGYLSEANHRAGDVVSKGDILATLDMTDLRLEKLRWQSERTKQEREHSEALARKERSRVRILAAQIDQATAQMELIDQQLARMRLLAPFDGLIVAGDLSQALGSPVERGDVLFEVAPLSGFRVVLKVDERDVGDLATGQTGHVALAAMPTEHLPVEVTRITPVSRSEEGQTFFVVETALTDPGDFKLRPGMEGVAKINIDERRLIWIWTRRTLLWGRLFLWSWTP